jgi:preprotein translocase subunit SecD
MIIAYGTFGLIANLALIVNGIILVAAMSALQATLTLPGIAGIVLTIGMAVDANVLIFEHIREEVRTGRTPVAAIDSGFTRALTTIIDSNLTTLFAAGFLYLFGSGPVRGFAVTLGIGIIASMFTAITLTRLIVVAWLRRYRPRALAI